MKKINKRGIAMPVILGLILCIAIWIGTLAWSMTNSRSRYQKVIKRRQANFLARSAFQHFFLKFKTMQRHCPESVKAVEQANEDEKRALYGVFVEDVIVPPDDKFSANRLSYSINEFDVESIDFEKSMLTLSIESEGKFGGERSLLKRLVRISR